MSNDTPNTPGTEAAAFSRASLFDAEAELAKTAHLHASIVLRQLQREESDQTASDNENGVFFMLGEIEIKNVLGLIHKLNRFERQHGSAPFTVNISSYGGDIVAGFILYDRLRELSAAGHKVTTKGVGVIASMAFPILLAGDDVVLQRNAMVLMHQPSFGAGGSLGSVEDSVALGTKLYDQILGIMSKSSGQPAASLKKKIGRTDHWLTARETVDLGFGRMDDDARGF